MLIYEFTNHQSAEYRSSSRVRIEQEGEKEDMADKYRKEIL